MARQGLQGRARRRRRGLTRPDKRAGPVRTCCRDFTADGVDEKWVGDFKQIDTGRGRCSSPPWRTCSPGGCWASRSPTATPPRSWPRALNMAAAVRGGTVAGVIFHTARALNIPPTRSRRPAPSSRSMGRVGCALDNAAAESFSTLEHELISRRRWHTRDQARRDIAVWIDTWYQKTAPLHQQHDQRLRTSQRSLNQPSTIRGKLTPRGNRCSDRQYLIHENVLRFAVRLRDMAGRVSCVEVSAPVARLSGSGGDDESGGVSVAGAEVLIDDCWAHGVPAVAQQHRQGSRGGQEQVDSGG